MVTNRSLAFDLIIEVEAAYVDDPLGGPTKYGVTIPTAKKLGFDKDADGDVDENDIMLLDISDARQAFFQLYWEKIAADAMPEGVDILAADLAYHSGAERVPDLYDYNFYRFVVKRFRYYLMLANKREKYRGVFRGWCNRLETLIAACEAKFPNL